MIRLCVASARLTAALGYADPYLKRHPGDWVNERSKELDHFDRLWPRTLGDFALVEIQASRVLRVLLRVQAGQTSGRVYCDEG